MLGELELARGDGEACLTGSHGGDALAVADALRQVLVEVGLELRLVVPEIELGRSAVHVQVDDALGLGGEVRVAGERLMHGVRGLGLAGEQAGEGDAADAESGGAQEASAVQEAQVVLDRVVHRLRVSSRLRRRLAVRVHAATSGAGREASGFDSPKVISWVASAGWAT